MDKAIAFLKKYQNVILATVFILFAMFFAFYLRSGTANLPGLDQQAEASLYAQIEGSVRQGIRAQHPLLPEQQIAQMVQNEMGQIRRSGTFQSEQGLIDIEEAAKQQADAWRSNFQTNGQTYLTAIDPYHFFKHAKEYAEYGYVGNELKEIDGELVPWRSHTLAPEGRQGHDDPEFHIWLMAKLFNFKGVDSDLADLLSIIFFLPAIFAALCAIPSYFIIRKFTNDYYALFGTLIFVSVSTFVARTMAGFVDTDAYNVLFPLIVTALLLYAFTAKDIKYTIGLSALAGFFQGFFFWAWSSGWFIFLFLLAVIVAHVGYLVVVKYLEKKNFKFYKSLVPDAALIGSFVISSFIFTYVFIQRNIFSMTFSGLFSRLRGIAAFDPTNIWPNVYSSVAELNPASFSQIMSSSGGQWVFFIALIGLLGLSLDFTPKHFLSAKLYLSIGGIVWFFAIVFGEFLVRLTINNQELFLIILFLPVILAVLYSLINKNSNLKVFLVMLLTVWMAGTVFMSLNGVRFILLLAPAFGIAAGFGFYYIGEFVKKAYSFVFEDNQYLNPLSLVTVALLFLLLFIPIAQSSAEISRNSTPNFDDAWFNAMDVIQAETSEDAIITSWWDFGHFFRAHGDRGVTFDGASQTTPQSHWVGKLLLENDDEVSQDILQMLVCGGNQAFDTMYDITNDSTGGVLINKVIYETLGESPEDSRDVLRNTPYFDFSKEHIDAIMEKLACDEPRENVFITSGDMVGKAGVWAHWGLWDFTRKYVLDNYRRLSPEEIASNIDEPVELIQQYVQELQRVDNQARAGVARRTDLVNQWLAQYPSYVPIEGRTLHNCRVTNQTITCDNSIRFDAATGQASSQINAPIRRVFLPQGDELVEIPQSDAGEVDVVFVPTNGGYQVLLAQYPLGGSVFTRLFYLDGLGTTYFEKMYDTQSITGLRIILWRTLWDHDLP